MSHSIHKTIKASYAPWRQRCRFEISLQQSENSVLPGLLLYVQENDNTAEKSVKINYTFLQEIHIIPECMITTQSGNESVCTSY